MTGAIGQFILSKSPWLNYQQSETNSKIHQSNQFAIFRIGVADFEQSWKSLINTLLSTFYLVFCSIFDPIACAVIALGLSFACWLGAIGKGSIAHWVHRPLIAHQW